MARRARGRPTPAGSGSASSGTWAGCTTRSTTSRATRCTAATTTTSSPSAWCTRSARTSCCRSRTTRSCTARARCSRRCRATAGSSSRTCARSTGTCGRIPARSCSSWAASSPRSASGTTTRSLDWHLLDDPSTPASSALVRDLNHALPRRARALGADYDPRASRGSTPTTPTTTSSRSPGARPTARARSSASRNLSPVPRHEYRLGLPRQGRWREVLNTDSRHYGGSDVGNLGGVVAEPFPGTGSRGRRFALPPLAVVWLVPDDVSRARPGDG